ncbi:uncharacterized protein Z519_06106 [Cladophialophora bantiana CBS 173.52]|uniref:FAS1 domain-containing protein n=1 Tax=Cladophialophora bantiana (strain ATCC 10958 / CBS 173.52 / CDC B-1940 / NIH 8579) TaxID=1442370 RepID=A0A0D2EUI7_CLAB1|nr:uncharacterized protein Z519_06106 [Cladophialophora bantiana CBS 173.52]KIW93501.1 hypothetical protein Z519_06106 [Cladophialophora bantiana CBS 173.52]
MSFHYIIVLSALAIGPVATQHFQPSETQPSWSWAWSPSSIHYTQPSWSAETPTWTPTVYTSEAWTSVAAYTPSVSIPTWPEDSSSWSPISYPSHTWSSETSAWSSWQTTIYSPHSWPSETATWLSWPTSKSWSSVAWPSPSPSPSLPSLNDALIAAGAAKFAALIASDPVVSAAFAANVPAVFAPTDQFIDSTVNITRFRKRATLTPAQQQQLLLHATQSQSEINGLRTPPGAVVPTKDTKANLKGSTQKVVSKPKNNTKTTSSKRWAPFILPRQDNSSTVDTLVDIYSGLGDSVGVITADIPFDGGLIHTTDGLFTLPLNLSSTARTTGQTSFVSLASASNQSSILDTTPLITVFIPTNEAFAAANISPSSSGISSILAGHVVQDFAGYLPSLADGSSYVTQSGATITVTIQGDDYFINNAKIVSSNLILENGVAHVIDAVGSHLSPLSTLNLLGRWPATR